MLTCIIKYHIDPTRKEQFAQSEKFLLREDRTFLKLASVPHGARP